jgi:exopolysaccharide biosynthesis polyprenyl glycosylphosphotransferase
MASFTGAQPTPFAAPTQVRIKHGLDLLVAAVALVLLSPLFAVIAVLIKLDSPGPVFFRQVRAGRYGRPFKMVKFRSMRADAPPVAPSPGRPDDPRVTRIGRILRETSLDELPQLWNVLRGEMSLVGPRPALLYQAQAYSARERRRLEARPGITGLAQVTGRGELTWPEKIELDLYYIDHYSLWLDAVILLKTVHKVLSRSQVYESERAKGPSA